MKLLVYIFPVSVLVAYSQLIVKWRSSKNGLFEVHSEGAINDLFNYLSDPYIISGYFMALIGSFLWLFVISKIPLSIGFPIYIAITFLLVILGGWLFLGEQMTAVKLISALVIFTGILIGVSD